MDAPIRQPEVAWVLFGGHALSLADARAAFDPIYRFGELADTFAVRWRQGGPVLRIGTRDAQVTARWIVMRLERNGRSAQARNFAARRFDACFQVTFPDLEAAREDNDSLIETLRTLQRLSNGCVFLRWTGKFWPSWSATQASLRKQPHAP